MWICRLNVADPSTLLACDLPLPLKKAYTLALVALAQDPCCCHSLLFLLTYLTTLLCREKEVKHSTVIQRSPPSTFILQLSFLLPSLLSCCSAGLEIKQAGRSMLGVLTVFSACCNRPRLQDQKEHQRRRQGNSTSFSFFPIWSSCQARRRWNHAILF